MKGRTHKVWGLASGIAVLSVPTIQDYLINHTVTSNEAASAGMLLVFGSVLGSLFADVDMRESSAGYWLSPLFFWLHKKEHLKRTIMFRHRHIFHSIWIPLFTLSIAFALIEAVPWAFLALLGVSAGLVSHIFADWVMSKTYFLSPFKEKGFSLLHLEGREKLQKVCDGIFFVLGIFLNIALLAKGVLV